MPIATEITQITDRINANKKVEEYKTSDVSKYFRRVERVTSTSPNILAVVNFPDNPNGVLTRGYIFNIDLEKAYGNVAGASALETAVRHFVIRSSKLQGFVTHANGKRKEAVDPLLYLETAVQHFINKSSMVPGFLIPNDNDNMEKETKEPLLYLIGFVKGKDWNEKGIDRIDRDIMYFPFEKSDIISKGKANPFFVKSSIHEDIGTGGISTINPNEMEDLYPLLAAERIRRLTLSQDEFKNTFPDLSSLGIRYV